MYGHEVIGPNEAINTTIQTLSYNFNAKSKNFGRPICNRRGQYILGTVNGDDLEVKSIEVAVAFINEVLQEWDQMQADAKSGKGDKKKWYHTLSNGKVSKKDKERIASKLTLEAFEEFKAKFTGAATGGGPT